MSKKRILLLTVVAFFTTAFGHAQIWAQTSSVFTAGLNSRKKSSPRRSEDIFWCPKPAYRAFQTAVASRL